MGIGEVVDGKVEETPVVEAAPIVEAPAVEAAPVVEAPAAETPPVAAAPAVEEVKDGQHVPLPTFLDMRDRAIAAEKREAAREAERQQQPPAKAPDPYDDPKGYDAHIQGQIDGALQQQKLDTSWHLAVRDHGQEATEQARNWAVEKAKTDPLFRQQLDTAVRVQALPLDWIVRQHKRDGLLSQIGDDPDAWVRTRAAELGLNAPPITPVIETQQAPITPPRSIAATSSKNGGVADVPLGPMAALEAVFTR